jgi:iron complex outermembrane receptor protein
LAHRIPTDTRAQHLSRFRAGCIACIALLLASPTGAAEEDGPGGATDPWAGIEEMIVVGSGGAAALLAAPTSVVAFDAADLAAMGSQNVGDLAEYTPNLEITSPFAASNPQLFIRGVGLQDSNSNAASAVAVLVDDVYMASPAGQLSQLYDVENVEVLRGPQGALVGRNASAGAIRVTSRRPVHEYQGEVSATYGRFEQLDLSGALNIPVVQDVIATRFAFKYAERDFLGRNRCHDFYDVDETPPRVSPRELIGTKCKQGTQDEVLRYGNSPIPRPREGINNRQNWAARNLWLFQPNEELSFLFNVHGTQNLGRAPSFQHRGTSPVFFGNPPRPRESIFSDDNDYFDFDRCTRVNRQGICVEADMAPEGGDPYEGDYSRVGDERLTALGANIAADWTSGPWRLDTVVAWEYNDREAVIDIDASPFVASEAFITDTATEYFADARLTWNDDKGLEILVGTTALYDGLRADNILWVAPNNFLDQNFKQKTYHWALFGNIEWELSETLVLKGGARLNYERKNFVLSSTVQRLQNNEPTLPGTPLENERALSEEFRPSGEVILEYNPVSDVTFYWRFSRGYKGRHFNANALFAGQSVDPVQPEFVNAFEVGWKATLLDGMILWNGAGFFYDYENQQVFQLQDSPENSFPVNTLINAEDSRLIGGETELTFRWEGLEVAQSIGIQYSEFSDFRNVQTDVRTNNLGNTIITFRIDDFSSNQLVNSPELSYVSYAQYRWEIEGIGVITPRFDWRFKSRVFYTPENDSRIGSEPRWLLDARLAYATLDGTIEIAGWVRNITDEIYPLTAFDRKDSNNAISYVMSDPRTYGVSASIRF